MRVAVAGGTGRVGRHVVAALRRDGHDAVVLSRSAGVDLLDAQRTADALRGVAAVVDATNTATADATRAEDFFGQVTRNLLAAERKNGVGHHVLLSIHGIDRVVGSGHYAGKRLQERLVGEASVPSTVVRATQFHDFAEMVVGWTRRGDVATIAPLLVQPVDPGEVGELLAELVTGPAQGVLTFAGPEPHDLVDMARRTLAARGEQIRLVPTWTDPFGLDMSGEALLPGPDARLGTVSFDDWLARQA